MHELQSIIGALRDEAAPVVVPVASATVFRPNLGVGSAAVAAASVVGDEMTVEKNFKCRLNEFCQVRGWVLPRYTTSQEPTTGHWLSTVSVQGRPFEAARTHTTKRDAEEDVAQRAWSTLSSLAV